MMERMKPLHLTEVGRARLDPAEGEALQFAMQVVVRAARIMGAPRLIDAGFAHIEARQLAPARVPSDVAV
jgi:predicted aconitase